MKEYLMVSNLIDGPVKVGFSDGRSDSVTYKAKVGNELCTNYHRLIEHAINSHDELVAEVEMLRKSLSWAVGNLPFENAYEWSDDENADAHYEAIRLLGEDE